MGRLLYKAPDGGYYEIVRVTEDNTQKGLQQGRETCVLLDQKVRPEAFPSGLPMAVWSKIYATSELTCHPELVSGSHPNGVWIMKRFRHLYGPVPSRRLGRSLGVDLVPHKICTYDCIYCQIGKTTGKTLARKEYVPVGEILDEIRTFLKEDHPPVDHISLGGSGEPTLHSGIRSIIEGIQSMTMLPVAVITNGSLFYEEEVRTDLLRADVVLPSLDAVSPEVFEKINRPGSGFSIENILRGLIEFRKIYQGQIWLEILFCRGVNDTESELLRMKEAIRQIRPDLIHLNTVVRPPSEKWVAALALDEMEKIRAFFGERASVISEFDRHVVPAPEAEMAEKILSILRRRPLSLSDLSRNMGLSQNELETFLGPLVEKGNVRVRSFQDIVFYEAAQD
jgi:wyosine [tRNA(Phe)-imidazoG37] synthetase (radical SAM superfamily)